MTTDLKAAILGSPGYALLSLTPMELSELQIYVHREMLRRVNDAYRSAGLGGYHRVTHKNLWKDKADRLL